VGFDSGDGRNFYATPKSRTPAIIDIVTDSNVGVPGKMIFSPQHIKKRSTKHSHF